MELDEAAGKGDQGEDQYTPEPLAMGFKLG
jgi:hypothetical protein